MEELDCIECDGVGGFEEQACWRCKGSGIEPAEWIEPEGPPPHTDADAPPWAEPTRSYAIPALDAQEVDEEALRAYMDEMDNYGDV